MKSVIREKHIKRRSLNLSVVGLNIKPIKHVFRTGRSYPYTHISSTKTYCISSMWQQRAVCNCGQKSDGVVLMWFSGLSRSWACWFIMWSSQIREDLNVAVGQRSSPQRRSATACFIRSTRAEAEYEYVKAQIIGFLQTLLLTNIF